MPHRTHDTTTTTLAQAAACQQDDWNREVVPRLPASVQQQAMALKAFERSRQIHSATDLLRGVLTYVYTVHSFQHLSMWSLLLGMADVSATNWRKREAPSQCLAELALARSPGGVQFGLALGGARRLAAHFADRRNALQVPRCPGHGVAGAYGL